MARFDVFAYGNPRVPLLVDVQADLLGDLKSTVVVPLVRADRASNDRLTRLHPEIAIAGKPYLFMATDIGAVPRATLGDWQANLEADYREIIIGALDFLFQGF